MFVYAVHKSKFSDRSRLFPELMYIVYFSYFGIKKAGNWEKGFSLLP